MTEITSAPLAAYRNRVEIRDVSLPAGKILDNPSIPLVMVEAAKVKKEETPADGKKKEAGKKAEPAKKAAEPAKPAAKKK